MTQTRRHAKRPATALASTVVFASVAVGCGGHATVKTSPSSGRQEPNAVVDHVIDGDTIDVVIDGRRERVRLIGIDTPETKDEDAPIECYGPEATALTELLLPEGAAVRLERDAEPRDDYGRLLAYVHRPDGLFVNLELARQGAATALSIRPNTTYASVIAVEVDGARRAGRGLWGACPPPS